MSSSGSSLAFRAVLAIVLLIGFYALAIGIAAGLLYIPYAEVVYLKRISFKITIFCLAGAFIILRSLIPSRDLFVPPGPRILKHHQPRLFQELEKIAAIAKQTMPRDVYLLAHVNAWVARRGGILGIGSRPMMGLGLPLMQALNSSEFRGVVAHEFGHFYGGDTHLGPWIYNTRSAIGRTVLGLSQHSSLLHYPFLLYGKAFLWITQAVSRHQEYTADGLGARIAGKTAMISGLQKTHAASVAFHSFWRDEYMPVLGAGYIAPMADGFSRFLKEEAISKALSSFVRDEIAQAKSDPYDSHPPLRERIIAIRNLPVVDQPPADTPAISWLNDVERLEKELLVHMAGREMAGQLKPIQWKDTVNTVYVPAWKAHLMNPECRRILEGLAPGNLPDKSKNRKALEDKLLDSLSREERKATVTRAIGFALAIALHQKGFQFNGEPGSEVICRRDQLSVEPFSVMNRLGDGSLTAQAWLEFCSAAEILTVKLESVGRGWE